MKKNGAEPYERLEDLTNILWKSVLICNPNAPNLPSSSSARGYHWCSSTATCQPLSLHSHQCSAVCCWGCSKPQEGVQVASPLPQVRLRIWECLMLPLAGLPQGIFQNPCFRLFQLLTISQSNVNSKIPTYILKKGCSKLHVLQLLKLARRY